MNIAKIQTELTRLELDGWLLADFHGRNTVAAEFLGLTGIVTRRSFYYIPASGEPTLLVSPIEYMKFNTLPGKHIKFVGWRDLEARLKALLQGCKKIAMEYSPNGRLPYVGLVDAGTIELVRSIGPELVPSADMVALFQACLSESQQVSHQKAADNLIRIVSEAHGFISDALQGKREITEFDVVQFILGQFEKCNMTTEFPPNCSVDANAGDPHYEPHADTAQVIKKGQLILIDQWAKLKDADAAYGDITWMAYAGAKTDIPERYQKIFGVIRDARDAAVAYLKDNFGKAPLYGADADDACRKVVDDAGYGEYFTHRTGHSITTHEHGSGPNIDNLETEDRRELQPGHLFSIEPGVYMEDCGFRTEINAMITPDGPKVTTLPLQNEIVALL